MMLEQRQVQKLMLTPELRQAITILQFSSVELFEYVHEACNENPVLQIKTKKEYTRDLIDFATAKEDTSLEAYLMEQVMLIHLSIEEELVFKYLIRNLDERGWLVLSPEDIMNEYDVTREVISNMISLLQQLEPAGVGARTMIECLTIQMERAGGFPSFGFDILTGHFENLTKRKFHRIATALSISVEDVQNFVDRLKTLHTRPAAGFSVDPIQYISPDVILDVYEDYVEVRSNQESIPAVTVNRLYANSYENLDHNATVYVNNCFRKANQLLKNIQQRKETICKVTKAIAEYQFGFFKNNEALQPMTLRDIAQKANVHESTVSRVTHNKYVQTPRGVFELKSFFTKGILSVDGSSSSPVGIKEKIKAIIMKEDKCSPISDEKLLVYLHEQGIIISRRTIAKYRAELSIPSSAKRKRFG